MNSQCLSSSRCGYIAFLGQPNAGKSTLLNSCVGTKLVGVSRKPETTRHRILGIYTTDHTQMLFLDTPGLHPPHHHKKPPKSQNSSKTLQQFLHRGAMSALGEADVIFYLIDITKGVQHSDLEILEFLLPRLLCHTHLEILLSKSDRLSKKKVQEQHLRTKTNLEKLSQPLPIHSFSSKSRQDISWLKKHLTPFLPLGEFLYDKESYSNRSERFFIAEIIREQIFRNTGQELPYATKVRAEAPKPLGKGLRLDVTLVVGKKSHKGMLIGKQGSFLKNLGIKSRELLEAHFQKKITLKLWVKVEEHWHRNLRSGDDELTL